MKHLYCLTRSPGPVLALHSVRGRSETKALV